MTACLMESMMETIELWTTGTDEKNTRSPFIPAHLWFRPTYVLCSFAGFSPIRSVDVAAFNLRDRTAKASASLIPCSAPFFLIFLAGNQSRHFIGRDLNGHNWRWKDSKHTTFFLSLSPVTMTFLGNESRVNHVRTVSRAVSPEKNLKIVIGQSHLQ